MKQAICTLLYVACSVVAPSLFANQIESEYDFLLKVDTQSEDFYRAPWSISIEFNDSGIESEDELREVFSITKAGLFSGADFFAMDYETDSFDRFDSFSFQYESDTVYKQWAFSIESFYIHEQIRFEGENIDKVDDEAWGAGLYFLELSIEDEWIWQWGIGARWHSVDSEDVLIYENESTNDFFLPGIKILFQSVDESDTVISGYLTYETNLASVADTKNVQRDVIVPVVLVQQPILADLQVEVDLEKSFQLLSGQYHYQKTIFSSEAITQRLKMDISGLYSFGDTLLPQFQKSVGGLYSVRGYDDQVLSGNRVVEVRAEYQVLMYKGEAENNGLDLWLFFFTDWADVYRDKVDIKISSSYEALNQTRKTNGESLQASSIGIGFDVQLNDISTFYLAWAHALEADGVSTESGDNRLHAYLRLHF